MDWLATTGDLGGRIAAGLTGLIDFMGLDSAASRKDRVFTTALVALCAKMARADGVVTEIEIAAFRRVVELGPGEEARIMRLFDLAHRTTDGFEHYADQIRTVIGNKQLLLDVLDGLFFIAAADGVVHERERLFLARVAEIFGFDEDGYRRIEARHVHRADDPYRVLGADRNWTFAALQARYRVMVKDHHPDRSIAAGLPPEAIAIATRRLAAINAAWEAIARQHPKR
jgi:DnaJ like chaperone protein